MAGFDNGTAHGGIFAQAKQFGPILRGSGPPVPMAANVGDLYVDTVTWFLYEKRSNGEGDDDNDPWGHYLFQVPVTYRAALKSFTATRPTNDFGVVGDYCLLWAGFPSYGLQPAIFGPKAVFGWPENGRGPDTAIDALYAGYALPVGLVDESAVIAYASVTRLIVVGILEEYVQPTPILDVAGAPVSQEGVQSVPVNVAVTLNPLYTATDQHAV